MRPVGKRLNGNKKAKKYNEVIFIANIFEGGVSYIAGRTYRVNNQLISRLEKFIKK